MDSNGTELKRIEALEARINQLAKDKSQLQLNSDLINGLKQSEGLEDMAFQITSQLMENLGGANITLFYSIKNRWYQIDAFRKKRTLENQPEQAILNAIQAGEITIIDEPTETFIRQELLITPYRDGLDWIVPLLLEKRIIGAIKMEGMMVVRPDMMQQLNPYFNYISLLLEREIQNYARLETAYQEIKEINAELRAEVAERKKTQTELRESEKRFRSTFEYAMIGICLTGIDGSFLMVNPALTQMLGYSTSEMKKLTFEELTHPDDIRISHQKVKRMMDHPGESVQFEKRYRKKDGDYIWASVGSFLLRDDQANPEYFITHIENITDRKLAESQLIANEVKFRTFFEQVADYVMILEPRESGLYIVDMNEAAHKIHGYTRAEMLNQSLDLLDETGVTADDERINMILEGQSLSFETIHRKKDGTTFPVSVLVKHIMVDNKKLIFSIERVLTEQKRIEAENINLEKQLRQSLKMEAIGTLAGGIAHDFNNILTPIIGYTDMLQSLFSEQSSESNYVKEVVQAAYRAKDLVKQILTFSRQADHERKPLRIYLVVNEAVKLLRSSIPTSIEIFTNIDKNCSPVLADPTQIHQIIMNLSTNAYHAMREKGGQLSIELDEIQINQDEKIDIQLKPGSYARLVISDTGHGMSDEVVQKVFDPYFTTKKKEEGTGMGLSIVHGIVNNHNGKVTVSSKIGEGSRFHIYLPCIKSPVEGQTEKRDIKGLKGTEHILAVDDEAVIVQMHKKMLESLGYRVTASDSSEEAYRIFADDPDQFDLLFTDMTMPGLSGADLTVKIREIRSTVPVILCTGYSERINKEQAEAIGIDRFIMKPASKKEITVAVREVLDKSKI